MLSRPEGGGLDFLWPLLRMIDGGQGEGCMFVLSREPMEYLTSFTHLRHISQGPSLWCEVKFPELDFLPFQRLW